jgi:hypothetical protein
MSLGPAVIFLFLWAYTYYTHFAIDVQKPIEKGVKLRQNSLKNLGNIFNIFTVKSYFDFYVLFVLWSLLSFSIVAFSS